MEGANRTGLILLMPPSAGSACVFWIQISASTVSIQGDEAAPRVIYRDLAAKGHH